MLKKNKRMRRLYFLYTFILVFFIFYCLFFEGDMCDTQDFLFPYNFHKWW
jgi:hypothetical protein